MKTQYNRREFLAAMALSSIAAAIPTGCGRSKGFRYPRLKNGVDIENILLISMDTTRADILGCYGNPVVQTPVIDKLATEGLVFENHISAASSTLTSHTSLMTGAYPHTHGIPRNGYIVNDQNRMLAEYLRDDGFQTAAIIGAFPLDKKFNFQQGFDHYDADYTFAVKEIKKLQRQRRGDAVTDATLRWLGSSSAKQPRFMFIHYFDPHMPFDAPAPYGGMYRNPSIPFDDSMDAARQARLDLACEGSEPLRDAYWAEYGAEVTYCDHHIGRLFAGLEERGMMDQTLIVLTGDHGHTFSEHENKLNHGGSVYDTEVRTPLIVKFPGKPLAGERVKRIVSNTDVTPTILHLLDLEPGDRVEGFSFASILDGNLPPRDPVFAEATQPWWNVEFDSDPLWPNRGKYQCVRTERYKFIMRPTDNRLELYDLRTDPMEQDNLLTGTGPKIMQIAGEMQPLLEMWRDDVRPFPSQMTPSRKARRILESLGYTGGDK